MKSLRLHKVKHKIHEKEKGGNGVAHTESFLAQLYRREYPVLYRVAYRLTGSRDDAQDMIQKTFLLAISQQEELSRHPNPGGWLVVTLNNLVKNERRRMAHQMEIPLEDVSQFPAQEPDMPFRESLPDELTAEEQQLLSWKFELELDHREMARRLGISPMACRARLSRLLKKCRDLMDHPPEPEKKNFSNHVTKSSPQYMDRVRTGKGGTHG